MPTNNSILREEYESRINRVIDYIEANIASEMSLEALARVANFSPFHFHRIFRAMMNEPLFQFIQRVRLEKAAMRLAANPKMPVTAIAYECGFSGSASFARAFRTLFGVSASEWRAPAEGSKMRKTNSNPGKAESKKGKSNSKARKDKKDSSVYIEGVHSNRRRNLMKKPMKPHVEIKNLPDMTVAYVRNVGPYKGDSDLFGRLIGKLCKWAGPRGLLSEDTKIMAVYHDNPEVTEEQKLRLSICVQVPVGTGADGGIGVMTLAGGKCASARFELSTDEYQAAWNAVYGEWLPESGFQPDDRPPFELYHNDPKTHPQGKCIVDICVPVKPL